MKKHTLKRVLSLLLTLSLAAALLLPAAAAKQTVKFTDVSKDSWYYTHVDFVTDKGYFKGTGDGSTFDPEGSMTRAMFVTVLARMAKVRVKDNKATGFVDVPVNTWYTGSVKWAQDNGIVKGVGENRFNPDGLVTREEMCVMMDRFMAYYADRQGVRYVKAKNPVTFPDADKVNSFATASVKNCATYGLIIGYPDGLFHPQDNATRSQVAKVITVLYTIMREITIGGGDVPIVTNYTIVYHDELHGDRTETQTNNSVFAAVTPDPDDDYVFIGWDTADGSVRYQAGDTVEITSGTTLDLYAKWIAKSDLIARAVKGVMDDVNGILRTDAFTFNADITDGKRVQSLNAGTYSLPENVLAKAIEKSAELSISLVSAYDEMTPAERVEAKEALAADVNDLVDRLVDLVKTELGITTPLRDVTVAQLKEAVYEKVVTVLIDEGKDLWSNFRNANGETYCVSKVVIDVNGVTLDVNVSDVAGTHPDYKGEARSKLAARMAYAMVKDLYNDLKGYTGDYTNTITLDATVGFTFTPVAEAEGYPTVYPCTAQVTFGGDDLLAYKFDEATGSYVKVIINDEAQDAYAAAVEDVIDTALDTDIVKTRLNTMVNNTKTTMASNAIFSSMISALSAAGVANADEQVAAVINAWVAANMDPDNFGDSVLFNKYWNGAAVNFDNSAIISLVTLAANKSAELLYNEAENKVRTTLTTELSAFGYSGTVLETMVNEQTANMLTNTFKLVEPSNVEALITNYAAGMIDLSTLEPSVKDYLTSVMADWLRNKVAATAGNFAAAAQPAFAAYVNTAITAQVEANAYFAYLDKVLKVKEVSTMTNVKLQNLATLLTNAAFQGYVGAYGNGTVKRVTAAFAKVPAGASVTVNGVTIDKTVLAGLQSDTTAELCNALAALISTPGLKDLSIDSFAGEGIEFNASAMVNGTLRSYTFHLVIDVE